MIRSALFAIALLGAGASLALAAGPTQNSATAKTVPVAAAPAWTIDQRASRVAVSESVSGYAFAFNSWNADLRFDPNNLAGSRATVSIDMNSARTGDATNDATLHRSWMNADQHPRAVFTATSFRALGPNRYEAPGTLVVRGRNYGVIFTFTTAITGNQATVTGETKIDRTVMGFTLDPTFDWISRVVTVTVSLRATRAG